VSGEQPTDQAARRLANLRAVARHHQRDQRDRDQRDSPHAGTVPPAVPPAAPAVNRRARWGAVGSVVVVLAFLAGKLKLLVPLLKVTKLGTLLTMVVSVWAYAIFWGLPFAVGFVLLIFVHELGHALVMRRQGIRAGAPVFIPFVGAVIAMKSQPRNAWVEALVGIGGPVLGSLGALACLSVGWATGLMYWYALASTGFMLNLFNLIPISPLDGGRIVGVISRWLWVAGYAVGIAVFLATKSPLLFLILLLGLFNIRSVVRGPREGYFEAAPSQRLIMGVAYFGLMMALAVGMGVANAPLDEWREARARGETVAGIPAGGHA